MKNTKENILQTSLALFSRDGYEAVSVSAIAGALGMTKGALYRHYDSKRAIFQAILSRMEREDALHAQQFSLPTGTLEEMEESYRKARFSQLESFCRAQFRYWTEDPFASAFRRMLTLEQYRSPEMGALYQQYLGAGPWGYVRDLFTAWELPQPEEKATTLYGTMFLLYTVYDGAREKETAFGLLEKNLRQMECWFGNG